MSKNDAEETKDIVTEETKEEMPAVPRRTMTIYRGAPEEINDDPTDFAARAAKRPRFTMITVRLHGGMKVQYPHGWMLNQEFVLMYSLIREVCHPLRGFQDSFTRLVMPYAFCCGKMSCRNESLLPWLPPYATHEARINGVLIQRNYQVGIFPAGLRAVAHAVKTPLWTEIWFFPLPRWYAFHRKSNGKKAWAYNGPI